MANIEASQRDVPLFEVVEHIAGDLGQVVLQYEELDHKEIGLPAVVDFGGEHGRAPVGNWEAPLPVDGAIVHAWDRALADLIGAVRRAELRAKGRPPGSQFLEVISPGDFAEVADNPLADFDSTIGYEGKRVLEFKDTEATIVKSHPIGTPKVMWTDVCAESGAEILKLWPLQPDTANLKEMILAAAKDTGDAANGVRGSAGDETTEHGFDFDAHHLADVMPRLQGDAGPPEVERNVAAATPTKAPSRKVLWVATELKRLYPDGLTMKTIEVLARDLKTSESTVKRAFSYNGWSRTRAKLTAK